MSIKRIIEFIIIFLIFIFGYQAVIIYFQNGHEVNYKLASNDMEFSVSEKYKKNNEENGYLINITSSDNKKFVYYIKNTYNKQKKIIKKIDSYQKDDYLCIYPTTIGNNDDTEILCSDGKEIYSSYYVNNKINISSFIEQLNLKDDYLNDKSEVAKDGNVKFYKNNYYDNEYLELYRYKYLSIFNKGEVTKTDFSTSDIYKNENGIYLDRYFLVPIVNASNDIKQYYIINAKNGNATTMYFENSISPNIYTLGIVNNKAYIFDRKNKVEYEINPKKNSYSRIGDVQSGFKFYEKGEWVDKSITEFTKNKITFNEYVQDDEVKFSNNHILESDNTYYLIDGNKIYKVYKGQKDTRILLFEISNYNNLKVINNRIYYIVDDNIYRYDKYGIKILVTNNELKYNNTNIYYVYNS